MMIEDIFVENSKPFIIAEISQNHDGSLGQAHAFIDAVADCGVDSIKFQTHFAQEESTAFEPFRVQFSYEDKTRFDYWKRMEFTEEQWQGLFDHATKRKLEFLSSPFSTKALDLLDRIGVKAWKIGAGEVFNGALLEKAAQTHKPIILSTGLSVYDDIDKQIKVINKYEDRIVLLQCVTAYPSSPDMINIKQIQLLRDKYKCKTGISDHSATIYPSLAAAALGASVIEIHVTMSHYMFGPDVKASVDLSQLKQIVEGVSFIYAMRNSQIDYNSLTEDQKGLRKIFSKSMYAEIDLEKGCIISRELFKAKKPCEGIEEKDFSKYIGRRLKRTIEAGAPLKIEDIE